MKELFYQFGDNAPFHYPLLPSKDRAGLTAVLLYLGSGRLLALAPLYLGQL